MKIKSADDIGFQVFVACNHLFPVFLIEKIFEILAKTFLKLSIIFLNIFNYPQSLQKPKKIYIK